MSELPLPEFLGDLGRRIGTTLQERGHTRGVVTFTVNVSTPDGERSQVPAILAFSVGPEDVARIQDALGSLTMEPIASDEPEPEEAPEPLPAPV